MVIETESSHKYFWYGLIFFIIIVSITFLILWQSKVFDRWSADSEYNKTKFKALSNGVVIGLNYSIYDEDNKLIHSGTIHNNTIEEMLLDKGEYRVRGEGGSYYSTEIYCNGGQPYCILSVKAHPSKLVINKYNVIDNIYRVSIYKPDGIILNPILCVAWREPVTNIKSNYSEIRVIPRLYTEADKCFNISNIDDEFGDFVFFLEGSSSNFEVVLVDDCGFKKNCIADVWS
jgi:hypothetical protein